MKTFAKKNTRFEIYKKIQFSVFHQPDKVHFEILEAVIKCYARQRAASVSLKEISREASISYPTLKKKFKNVAQIKLEVMSYIRTVFVALVVAYFNEDDSNREKLQNYILGCFAWIDYLPSHHAGWTYLLRIGLFEPEIRKRNTACVDTGFERIKNIIQNGVELQEWHCEDVKLVSKKIQLIITAALFSETSENRVSSEYRSEIFRMCFYDLKPNKNFK